MARVSDILKKRKPQASPPTGAPVPSPVPRTKPDFDEEIYKRPLMYTAPEVHVRGSQVKRAGGTADGAASAGRAGGTADGAASAGRAGGRAAGAASAGRAGGRAAGMDRSDATTDGDKMKHLKDSLARPVLTSGRAKIAVGRGRKYGRT